MFGSTINVSTSSSSSVERYILHSRVRADLGHVAVRDGVKACGPNTPPGSSALMVLRMRESPGQELLLLISVDMTF